MKRILTLVILCAFVILSGCVIKLKSVKSGNIGVKQTFGKYKEKTLNPGLKVYSLGTRILQVNLAPTRFVISQPTRLSDGSVIDPTVHLFLKINPERAVQLLNEQYAERSRKVSPNSFSSWITSVTQECIAKTSAQYSAFEDVNNNRELYKEQLLIQLNGRFKAFFTIEDLTIPSVQMNREKANALDNHSVLTQRLINMDLEIQLAQKRIVLDSLRAVSERRTNEVINPSLTPEVLEKERIERNQLLNGNQQTIIIEN